MPNIPMTNVSPRDLVDALIWLSNQRAASSSPMGGPGQANPYQLPSEDIPLQTGALQPARVDVRSGRGWQSPFERAPGEERLEPLAWGERSAADRLGGLAGILSQTAGKWIKGETATGADVGSDIGILSDLPGLAVKGLAAGVPLALRGLGKKAAAGGFEKAATSAISRNLGGIQRKIQGAKDALSGFNLMPAKRSVLESELNAMLEMEQQLIGQELAARQGNIHSVLEPVNKRIMEIQDRMEAAASSAQVKRAQKQLDLALQRRNELLDELQSMRPASTADYAPGVGGRYAESLEAKGQEYDTEAIMSANPQPGIEVDKNPIKKRGRGR